MSNVSLLEEKLREATTQLARARSQAQRCAELEAENEALRTRHGWSSEFGGTDCEDGSGAGGVAFSSPEQAARMVAQLQQQLVVAMEDKGRLQAEASSARGEARDTQQRLRQLQAQHAATSATVREQEVTLRRQDQRLRFATQERDSVQGVLKAYQAHGKQGAATGVIGAMQAQADTQAVSRRQPATVAAGNERVPRGHLLLVVIGPLPRSLQELATAASALQAPLSVSSISFPHHQRPRHQCLRHNARTINARATNAYPANQCPTAIPPPPSPPLPPGLTSPCRRAGPDPAAAAAARRP